MHLQEILGMVKEAANTHMFKEHKFQAQKTIQKKQMHIVQITSLLAKETMPKLNVLWEENVGGLSSSRVGWSWRGLGMC